MDRSLIARAQEIIAAEGTIQGRDALKRAADGVIPVIFLPNGHRRFRLEDVEALRQPKASA